MKTTKKPSDFTDDSSLIGNRRIDNNRVIQALQNCLALHPDVAAAYLFGSAATGEAVVNDLDILILQYEGVDRFPAHARLVEHLAESLGMSADRIDLVFFDLNETNPALLYEAIDQGILLKNEAPELLADKIEALSTYFLENDSIIRRASQLKRERLEAFCEG